MPSVYIETSIVSYLRNRQSNSVIASARQLLTKQWWREQRLHYQLVISQLVLDEAAAGDAALAAERLSYLANIPLLSLDAEINELARALIENSALPLHATVDAQHLAIAAWHRVDYLLTWNCKHIANARMLPNIERTLNAYGHVSPVICTPENFYDATDEWN